MIYHIATREDWQLHQQETFYQPSAFAREGFVHCSNQNQVDGVLQRYFIGVKDLMLLHIEEGKLRSELKYEAAGNNELFPHIYGPINKDAIVKIETIGES